jgi:sugar (pentulose or hexulose) kinase
MRSALEGVAFALKDALAALSRVGGTPQNLRLAGGSSSFPFWRQLLADALQQELRVSAVKDASARGAALLAVQAAGYDALALSRVHISTVVTPGAWSRGYEGAYSSFGEVYARLYR